MRVCVIIPPAYGLFDQRSNIPLGPLYVSSMLARIEVEVDLISLLDSDGIPYRWPEADLYAMGFTTPQFDACIGILRLIRNQYPEAKIVAGGAHPTFKPYETLAAGFTSVICGEAELAMVSIKHDFPNLQKIYRPQPPSNLDEVPLPGRCLLPFRTIFNNAGSMFLGEHEGEMVSSIIASRGCPYNCAFCGNSPLAGLRHRSAENIFSEISQETWGGRRCFKFQDDSFTIRKDIVKKLGDLIDKELGPQSIAVRVHTRSDLFSEEIIPAMHKMNVEVVGFGIESGSQDILDLSRKGITVEQAEAALRLAHDSGLKTLGFFMFGLPWESERTVTETLEFVRRNRQYIDGADLSTFVPYPGCDIAENPEEYKMHILSHDYNEYWLTQKQTVLALPQGVSFDEMLRLQTMAYRTFAEFGYKKNEWSHDM